MRRHVLIAALMLTALVARADDAPLQFAGVVLYPDDTPAAGAKVWLVNQADDTGRVVATGETDADGGFSISGPRIVDGLPTEYCVCIKPEGHALIWTAAMAESDAGLEFVAELAVTLAGAVIGTNGEPVVDVRPLLKRVSRGCSFEPSGLDRPAPRLLMPPELQSLLISETDARGLFSFTNLPAGVGVVVTADVPGTACFERDFGWDALAWGAPVPLHLMECGTVTGRVVDAETGQPIGGIGVEVISRRALELVGWAGGRRYATITDAQGYYEVAQLPVDSYTVTLLPNSQGYWCEEARRLKVKAGGVTDGVDLQARHGIELRGTVINDTTGKPVEGAVVTGSWWRARDHAGRTMPALTDTDGRYVLILPPGKVQIQRGRLPAGLLWAGDDVQYALELALEADGGPHQFDLHVTDARRLTGTVIGPDGPLPGARVILLPERRTGSVRRTLTDAGGRFSFDTIRPGARCILHAWHDDAATLDPPLINSDDAHDITLHLTRKSRTRATGRVISTDGKVIPGAMASMGVSFSTPEMRDAELSGSLGASRMTDAKGRFRLDACLPNGRVSTRGSARGYQWRSENPHGYVTPPPLTPGEHIDAGDIKLHPLDLNVEGVVLDEDDQPVRHAIVHIGDVYTILFQTHAWDVTDVNGRFSFERVYPKQWCVWLSAPDHMAMPEMVGPHTPQRPLCMRALRPDDAVLFTAEPNTPTLIDGDGPGPTLTRMRRYKDVVRNDEREAVVKQFIDLAFDLQPSENRPYFGAMAYDDQGRRIPFRSEFGHVAPKGIRFPFDLPEAGVGAISRVVIGGPLGQRGKGEPIRFDDLLPGTAQESGGARAVLWHSELCAAPVDVVYAPGVAQPEGKRYVSTRVYVTCPDAMELGFSSGRTGDGIELQSAGRIFYCEGMKAVLMPEALEQYRGLLEAETREALAKLGPPDGPPARAVWGFWLRSRGDVQPGKAPERASVELSAFARGSASIYNIPIPPELTKAVEME